MVARPIGREQEQGQAEHREPKADQRARDADVLGLLLVEAEQGVLRLHESEQRDQQADQTPGIAQAPGPAGQAPDVVAAHDFGEHGVVEHAGDLERDVGQPDDHQHHQRDLGRRPAEPQQEAADHGDQREDEQPGLAPARRIGDGAEHRAHERDRDAARGHHPTPLRGAGHLVRRDALAEVGGVDEGDDHRGEGGVRPVVKRPGELSEAGDTHGHGAVIPCRRCRDKQDSCRARCPRRRTASVANLAQATCKEWRRTGGRR